MKHLPKRCYHGETTRYTTKGYGLNLGNQSPLVQEDTENIIIPQPKIILYLKDGLNRAERNFTKYPNGIA